MGSEDGNCHTDQEVEVVSIRVFEKCENSLLYYPLSEFELVIRRFSQSYSSLPL
jgi:hypothetical protein